MAENVYFITNRGKTLYETIKNLSSSTETAYILVGFFYFSGFFRLKDEFKDKKIKILIGLDLEKKAANALAEYEILKHTQESIADTKKKFYDSLVKAFSYSDIFDNPQIKESFKLFVDKITDGSIEIRKTKEANHAKLYIFENKSDFSQNGDYPGTVITGSSNLSIEGLEKRSEIDVISRDKAHFLEAKKIFEELWKDSIPIATKENFNEFEQKVLNKIWPTYELPTPYEVYVKVLSEYFKINKEYIRMPKDINRNSMNLKYQTDAIKQAIETIKKHKGIIIADVVGLGKSIIASSIAHNLNLDTIVIAPPHLKEQWEDYRRSYKFMGEVYSSGKIEEAIKDYAQEPGRKLIIVDEAHRYRNTDTINYTYLWLLCQGNYVALLTATPFNNTPEDIQSLIKLFDLPKKSTLRHIDNLSAEFKELIKKYKELKKIDQKEIVKQQADEIAKRIRYIVSPITIRRTRRDLLRIEKYKKDLEAQNIIFPKVNPPEVLSYSFNNLDKLYLDTIENFIENQNNTKYFSASRYKTILYIDDKDYKAEISMKYTGLKTKKEALAFIDQSQANLSSLIRRIFVKRFESSFGSFKNSIDDYIKSHQKIKEFYDKGKVPIYKKIEQIPSPEELDRKDTVEREEFIEKIQKLEKDDELICIDAQKLNSRFEKDLENDIEVLNKIKENWEKYLNEPQKYDYKLQELIKILNSKKNNKEKVIIFSEYSDTVEYLEKQLKGDFKVIAYHSKTQSESLKEEIEKNFDASILPHLQKDDYDILITTDILSEGINLHRANNIINYDVPYNPTRVIQRIGRVNRISKTKLKDISIYNFFPTKIGEKETKIKNISTLKMHMIHFLLGEDIQYLTTEEEIRNFYEEQYKKSEFYDEESWDAKYRDFLYQIEDKNPQLLQKALSIPLRTKIRRRIDKSGCIVFARKGENFIFKYKNGDKTEALSDEDAIKIFESKIDEKSYEVSTNFYTTYSEIKNNLFKTITLSHPNRADRWDNEVINKIKKLEEDANQNYPEYKDYISKMRQLIDLEVLPEYIIKTIRQIKFNSKEDIEDLKNKLPEFYMDEILKRTDKYDKEDDIVIIAEELEYI